MKYLFTTLVSDDLGLLTRTLPIARELALHGHQVAFCNSAKAPSKLIAEAGFDNLLPRHPLYHLYHLDAAGELNARGLYKFLTSARFKRDFGNLFKFSRQLVQALPTKALSLSSEVWSMDHLLGKTLNEHSIHAECEALIELTTDYGADVVVDAWNPFACVAARVLQKPLVTIIQADMHPDSRGFIWWKDPPPKLPTAVPLINKALSRYRLASVRKTEELFVGDLTLVLGMPETDPLPDAANVVYIGPMLWQKTAEGLPDWVDTLSQEKPVIWVYSGNPQYAPVRSPVDSLVVLQACIAALADEEVQVVLTTGHHPLPKRLLPLPANFHYALFVPGLDMAKRSDVLIHHGGYGSCQTGLYVGTPAVIIPTYSERESNARRVAAVGAGEIVLPTEGAWGKKHVDVEELRTKVRRVLSDPSYKINAARISAKMQAYGGHPQQRVLSKTLCLHPETAGVTPAYSGILENGRRLAVATASPPSFGV